MSSFGFEPMCISAGILTDDSAGNKQQIVTVL